MLGHCYKYKMYDPDAYPVSVPSAESEYFRIPCSEVYKCTRCEDTHLVHLSAHTSLQGILKYLNLNSLA